MSKVTDAQVEALANAAHESAYPLQDVSLYDQMARMTSPHRSWIEGYSQGYRAAEQVAETSGSGAEPAPEFRAALDVVMKTCDAWMTSESVLLRAAAAEIKDAVVSTQSVSVLLS